MKPGKLTAADFPPAHPEWTQRDHMLIAWGLAWGVIRVFAMAMPTPELYWADGMKFAGFVDADPCGVPILTPEMRQRLGDEWRKWRSSQP